MLADKIHCSVLSNHEEAGVFPGKKVLSPNITNMTQD